MNLAVHFSEQRKLVSGTIYSLLLYFLTGRPEEVPMQEIVIKNIQNFTREDFDQAKKDLDNHKDGDTNLKGFKYTYCPEQKTKNKETHSQETKKVRKYFKY